VAVEHARHLSAVDPGHVTRDRRLRPLRPSRAATSAVGLQVSAPLSKETVQLRPAESAPLLRRVAARCLLELADLGELSQSG